MPHRILVVLLPLLCACGQPSEPVEPDPSKLSQQGKQQEDPIVVNSDWYNLEDSGTQGPRCRVITETDKLKEHFSGLVEHGLKVESDFVVIIEMGYRGTEGHYVRIKNTKAVQQGQRIEIRYRFVHPDPGEVMGDAEDWPYVLLILPRREQDLWILPVSQSDPKWQFRWDRASQKYVLE